MSGLVSSIFRSSEGRLRNGWWVVLFLAVLAMLLFPLLLVSVNAGREVSLWEQVGIIALATVAIQLLRRRPVIEVTGRPDAGSLVRLGQGLALGAALMILPAAILAAGGWVRFSPTGAGLAVLAPALATMAAVAIAEELLFRGVLFQRLVDGVGVWPAQGLIAALFLLTHLGNPGMEGSVRLLAGANIFLASILFGQTFLRTRGLAAPIGLHLMANVTQGVILGFGVSGNEEAGLLKPVFATDAAWLTGGAFGLEASLPGLIVVLAFVAAPILWRLRAGPCRRRLRRACRTAPVRIS